MFLKFGDFKFLFHKSKVSKVVKHSDYNIRTYLQIKE